MATKKKWFGLAALVAAVGAGAAYAATKIKQSPETASNLYEDAKQKAKESPERASAMIDAAKAKVTSAADDSAIDVAEADGEVVDAEAETD